jgi:hypothetical protein
MHVRGPPGGTPREKVVREIGVLCVTEQPDTATNQAEIAALLMAYEGATAPLPAPTKVLGWL